VLQCCLPGFGFLLYIVKEVVAIGQLNQQTKRIILMCNQVLMHCNRSLPRIESHGSLSSITRLSCLHYGYLACTGEEPSGLASDQDCEMDQSNLQVAGGSMSS
jgi:hypothetical protein